VKEAITGHNHSIRLSLAPVWIYESECDGKVVEDQDQSDEQGRDATSSCRQTTNDENDGREAEDEDEDAVVEADPVAGDHLSNIRHVSVVVIVVGTGIKVEVVSGCRRIGSGRS